MPRDISHFRRREPIFPDHRPPRGRLRRFRWAGALRVISVRGYSSIGGDDAGRSNCTRIFLMRHTRGSSAVRMMRRATSNYHAWPTPRALSMAIAFFRLSAPIWAAAHISSPSRFRPRCRRHAAPCAPGTASILRFSGGRLPLLAAALAGRRACAAGPEEDILLFFWAIDARPARLVEGAPYVTRCAARARHAIITARHADMRAAFLPPLRYIRRHQTRQHRKARERHRRRLNRMRQAVPDTTHS